VGLINHACFHQLAHRGMELYGGQAVTFHQAFFR
jgi:hypothetical protein